MFYDPNPHIILSADKEKGKGSNSNVFIPAFYQHKKTQIQELRNSTNTNKDNELSIS